MKYKLKKISGDASFREFYRLKKNNKTSIIVTAKKEKFKNPSTTMCHVVFILRSKGCQKINGWLIPTAE